VWSYIVDREQEATEVLSRVEWKNITEEGSMDFSEKKLFIARAPWSTIIGASGNGRG